MYYLKKKNKFQHIRDVEIIQIYDFEYTTGDGYANDLSCRFASVGGTIFTRYERDDIFFQRKITSPRESYI